MKAEIHMRPMILPLIAGAKEQEWELDVWLYLNNDVGEVVLETVCSSKEKAIYIAQNLQQAMKSAVVINESSGEISG